jgi:RimJ/RimL family protein N-acetyltransferase
VSEGQLPAPETVTPGWQNEAMADIALREIRDEDLDGIFDQMRDPDGVWMAAFTAEDPDDRAFFDTHMARVRADPGVTMRAITRDGQLVGHVASFDRDGELEVTYGVDRSAWGQGVASRALDLLLQEVRTRPVHARAASDNLGSLRVLERAGFRIIGTNRDFAQARKAEIEETILRLD